MTSQSFKKILLLWSIATLAWFSFGLSGWLMPAGTRKVQVEFYRGLGANPEGRWNDGPDMGILPPARSGFEQWARGLMGGVWRISSRVLRKAKIEEQAEQFLKSCLSWVKWAMSYRSWAVVGLYGLSLLLSFLGASRLFRMKKSGLSIFSLSLVISLVAALWVPWYVMNRAQMALWETKIVFDGILLSLLEICPGAGLFVATKSDQWEGSYWN